MKEYKIIADSSCELPQEYQNDSRFVLAQFRVEVDGVPIRNSEKTNTRSLLEKVANSKTFASFSCPSPDIFYNCISEGEAKRVYIITMASKLSGCYVSAMIAKKLYEDAHNDKEIVVIDSKSVSGGECQLALLAMELEEQGLAFEDIKKQLLASRDKLSTVVLYDNITALYKNINFSKIKDVVSKASNVKSFFISDKEVEDKAFADICLKENISQLSDRIAAALKGASEQTRIVITHCNNLIGAEKLRDMLMEKTGLSNFVIMSTSGLSSMLACEGGIFVTF